MTFAKIAMTMISKLFLLICFFSCAILGQERIIKRMAGPANGQYRIAVAFITPTDESYKLQSLIIDIEPVKNKKDHLTGTRTKKAVMTRDRACHK